MSHSNERGGEDRGVDGGEQRGQVKWKKTLGKVAQNRRGKT